jgi:hypothetical protein
MSSWRVLIELVSSCEQQHLWLAVQGVRYSCPSLSDIGPFRCQILVKLNFMKILSAFLELLAVSRTDRNGGGKQHAFAISRPEHVSSKQWTTKKAIFFCNRIMLFSFPSL